MRPQVILWLYLVVLLAGGIFGFVKAKSAVSLVTSLAFGALIALAAAGIIPGAYTADLLLTILVVVFAWRFQKTKKLMPAGVMTLVTIAALLVRAMMMWG